LSEIFGAVGIFVVCRARDLEMMGNTFAFHVNITGNIFIKTNGRPVYKLHPVTAYYFRLMFQLIQILGYEAMFFFLL